MSYFFIAYPSRIFFGMSAQVQTFLPLSRFPVTRSSFTLLLFGSHFHDHFEHSARELWKCYHVSLTASQFASTPLPPTICLYSLPKTPNKSALCVSQLAQKIHACRLLQVFPLVPAHHPNHLRSHHNLLFNPFFQDPTNVKTSVVPSAPSL